MHHFVYPSEDTYITNKPNYENKNFGINEILRIGTDLTSVKTLRSTKDYTYTDNYVTNIHFEDFTGEISQSSFAGSASNASGWIKESGSVLSFTTAYFSGSLVGSISGSVSGVSVYMLAFSGSLIGFSGSIITVSSGSFNEPWDVEDIPWAVWVLQWDTLSTTASYSGSGLVNGYLSGTLHARRNQLLSYTGSVQDFYGCVYYGYVTGIETRQENWWQTTTSKFIDRSLIKFDLNAISTSISNGEMTNPEFKLNLKVCNDYDLPITYAIYAFPVSQSWVNGNGYYSDEGSVMGASWNYRDYSGSSDWYTPLTTSLRPVVDFLNTSSNATASFAYGGGTWYYSSTATQSFSYESSDISMDVTNIVMAWISGTLPNNGFILMSSDEIVSTGSGFSLTFYGKDTNSIYSPYLDVMWSDWVWETGSVGTSSVEIINVSGGMTTTVFSGSSITVVGGISGSFSGSCVVTMIANYITASNVIINDQTLLLFTGSLTGSFSGTASYALGTISGSGLSFYADYFAGDIDGVPTSSISSSVTGSTFVGSVTGSVLSTSSFGFFSGSISSSALNVSGCVLGYYLDERFYSFGGFFACQGLSGNIEETPVVGNVHGLITITSSEVTIPSDIITLYPTMPYNEWPYTSTGYSVAYPYSPYNELIMTWYTWLGDVWVSDLPALPTYPITCSCGKTHLAQSMVGTFTSGAFSGSQFIAYYSDYSIIFATLSGSMSETTLLGSTVSIPLPSGIDPYAYAYVSGRYVNGTALGLYTVSSSIDTASYTSASFNGQFINGELKGAHLVLQLSGSVFTSSYAYTGSVTITSSVFSPINTDRSFTVIVKNLKPECRNGDLIRVGIFGRREFPLKTFEKTCQQSCYLVPELLPSSSYYAIRDNMSEEIIVDFDNYTRISCKHPEGNYFMLDTTGLAQERPYRILVRVESSGSKYTFDNNDVFKITR